MLNRATFVKVAMLCIALGTAGTICAAGADGKELYNGIPISNPWPPRVEKLTYDPMDVPYLSHPPAVIPIDVGRQLFVDDFLIESTTLRRTFHQAQYDSHNPVLRPDRPWERTDPNPMAMVFSDGVWFDPKDHLFKMWYMGGSVASTCYATSKDGLHWEKPALDVKAGTNVVQPDRRDSATVWLDLDEPDPLRRFKLFRVPLPGWRMSVYCSADGVHWGEPAAVCPQVGDRSTVFYNPFRRVWVYSLRADSAFGRCRKYREHPDAIRGANWQPDEPVWWIGADRLDRPRDDLKTRPELYNLDAVAYESVMLGLFSIWRGQPADRPKPNEILVGFSRDGFHWDRGNREPFIPVSEHHGDWNWGNVQSAGGCCLVAGDKLYFYVSGRKGVPGSPQSGESTTGLATLRRDGFASMDAAADSSDGVLTTRPVRFTGKHLFVNCDAADGELRAEIFTESGEPIAPFTRDNCVAFQGDRTKQGIHWTGSRDLSALIDRPVRFRFHLTRGRLYAFWVSPDDSGASQGYVAAGGPGFNTPRDTAGGR